VIPMGAHQARDWNASENASILRRFSRMTSRAGLRPGTLRVAWKRACISPTFNRLLAAERQFFAAGAGVRHARQNIGRALSGGAGFTAAACVREHEGFPTGLEFITGDAVSSKSGGRGGQERTGYDLHKFAHRLAGHPRRHHTL